MMGCECKGGFFALRDCDQPVANTCSKCNRGVCTKHLSPASGFTECLDCWARGHDGEAVQKPNDDGSMPPAPKSVGENASLDEDWAYGYRHRYYQSGYRPIYAGTYAGAYYYSSYDTRSFDDDTTADGGYDESDSGFGDS